jgi:hypothetical protein
MANNTVLIIGSGTHAILCYVSQLPLGYLSRPLLYCTVSLPAGSRESIQVPQVTGLALLQALRGVLLYHDFRTCADSSDRKS